MVQSSSQPPRSSTFSVDVDDDSASVQLPVPEEFICPITLQIMSHPLMTRKGLNFERVAILSWLQKSSQCPMTRQPLKLSDLVTNRALEARIREWKREHGLFGNQYWEDKEDIENERDKSLAMSVFLPFTEEEEAAFLAQRGQHGEESSALRSRQNTTESSRRTTPASTTSSSGGSRGRAALVNLARYQVRRNAASSNISTPNSSLRQSAVASRILV